MELKDFEITCQHRPEVFEIIPLGDVHIGARNCAETPFRKTVKYIKEHPNTYWIGGGDYLEAIKPNDAKRWDNGILPDWLLDGKPADIRKRLGKIVKCQTERFIDIVLPIADKCIGLIEGNHEYKIRQNYNDDLMDEICGTLGVSYLTDEALIRFHFYHGVNCATIKLYLRHGHLGGRTLGAEPNHLFRMLMNFDVDIALRGHTHNFHTLPPQAVMYINDRGKLPPELLQKTRHAANWGCWKYSHTRGLSTYESRAEYNAKPILALKLKIKPLWHTTCKGVDIKKPKIEIETITP